MLIFKNVSMLIGFFQMYIEMLFVSKVDLKNKCYEQFLLKNKCGQLRKS